ncbi:hypothetical protein HZA33_00610 [Candidatus Pacearchaeota archaeon]|nr:hypothetical protein [Candidatus Pacearchaeota archaeon]
MDLESLCLDDLLDREKMHEFLDDALKDIPKDSTQNLVLRVMFAALKNGMEQNDGPVEFAVRFRKGEVDNKQVERVSKCAMKIYSLGYALGDDIATKIRDKVSAHDDSKLRYDEMESLLKRATSFLSNIVYYFKPDSVESYRKNIEKDIYGHLQEGLLKGELKVEKKDIH